MGVHEYKSECDTVLNFLDDRIVLNIQLIHFNFEVASQKTGEIAKITVLVTMILNLSEDSF